MASKEFAVVGRVRRAHGIRGEVVVEPLTADPDRVFAVGQQVQAGTASGALWRDSDGSSRTCVVIGSRPFKGGLLLILDGITDRTEAERWRDRHLLVSASEIGEPAEGEIYLHELEGMRVLDEHGADIAVIFAWYEVPSGILLDVRKDAREATVPFNAHFVRHVNRAERTLTVTIPDELWHSAASS